MTQDISNTRDDLMRQRMLLLSERGHCFFCPEGQELFEKEKLHEGVYWYISESDSPYKGSVTHVMAVPKRHITLPEELTANELVELMHEMIPWMKENLNMSGISGVFRFGNTKITGATLHHLHFHFITGVERSNKDHPPIWAVVGFQKT